MYLARRPRIELTGLGLIIVESFMPTAIASLVLVIPAVVMAANGTG